MVNEHRVKEIGTQILEEAKNHIPSLHTEGGRRNALFDLCMKDQNAATQIFRFMDVFPSLRDEAVLLHLNEYLIDSNVDLGILSPLVKSAKIAPDTAVKTIKHFSQTMARSFIAGNTVQEGVKAVSTFKEGRSCTFDIVGEITTSEIDAKKYLEAYLHALDVLTRHYGEHSKDKYGKPKINLSVKLSALYEHFDPIDPENTSKHVRERLRPIFRKAKQVGAFINLDMEHFQYNAVTNKIFKELLMEDEFRNFEHAGAVVQAYLRSSEQILDDLISFSKKRGTPITIRLVKGAYWDHEVMLAGQNNWEVPVWINKEDTDANYEKLAIKLASNIQYTRAAFGSHNARSLAAALALVEEKKIDKQFWEFQKLFGVAEEIGAALEKMDVPLRDYVPCGELVPAMGYFVRRLLENSSNEAFVRGLKKDLDIEALLMNPLDKKIQRETQKKTKGINLDPHKINSNSNNNNNNNKQNKKGWFSKIFRNKKQNTSLVNEPHNKNDSDNTLNNHGFRNYPAGNFADPKIREGITQAMNEFERQKGAVDYGIYINGAWIRTNEQIYSKSPSNKKIIGRTSKASLKDVKDAIDVAYSAFTSWKNVSARDRAEYLFKTAELMAAKKFYLSALIIDESGKSWKEAYADVVEAIDFLNYYGKQMIVLEQEMLTQDVPGEENTTFYLSRGVTSVIAPWNFPLAILTGMASAALVAGNTVIMKPASDTVLIAGELMKLFDEAGLPNGVLNYVPCPGKIAEEMITNKKIEMIAFTGSEQVGDAILRKASETSAISYKNIIIETGGKNAIIIDESADPEQAVVGVLKSAFGYSGQKCSACSRVIVHEAMYELFVQKLKNAAESLRVGDSSRVNIDLGPVINEEAYDKIIGLLEKGISQGGKILVSGQHSKEEGYFIYPTVIEINEKNILAQEEVFGPVLSVLKAKNFEDALRLGNQTRYALTGGLYSRTPSHITKAKKEFEVGNLYVNRGCTGAVVGRQHFGGFKKSGLGSKAGGPDYLPRFMKRVVRTINQDRSGHIPNILKYVQ